LKWINKLSIIAAKLYELQDTVYQSRSGALAGDGYFLRWL